MGLPTVPIGSDRRAPPTGRSDQLHSYRLALDTLSLRAAVQSGVTGVRDGAVAAEVQRHGGD